MVPLRVFSSVLLVIYLVVVGMLTLQPGSEGASWGLEKATDILMRLNAPEAAYEPRRLEVLCNVAMLVPLPMLGMLVWPRTNWRDWTAYAFLISLTIEVSQIPIPNRNATFSDLAANTGGALIGGIIMAFLVWPWRHQRSGRT